MSSPSTAMQARIDLVDPARFLTGLDPVVIGTIISSAADVALILEDGVIQDVAVGSSELASAGYERDWRGRPWIDTVTLESRPKIEELLGAHSRRWREVNHVSAAGAELPIRYTAVGMGVSERMVAFGRDLRSLARLQQRLVEAHQDLERDYARLREAETRYRTLFEAVSEPVLVVDAISRLVQEANPAAGRSLGRSAAALAGQALADLFDDASREGVDRAISDAFATGEATGIAVRTQTGETFSLACSAFRHDRSTSLIVRLGGESGAVVIDAGASDGAVLEALPDGLVVVGPDLRILSANGAFAEMTHLVHRGQPIGASLGDFVGRSATDLNVLISNLKNHGVVRNFNTVVRDRFGQEDDVEISAVSATHQGRPAYGLSIRAVARRLRTTPKMDENLPSSAEQLTGLVGRMPLREIVRQSTDFIERLCIEAALEITNNNRASASEMLGLSRQGLYSKLRRFGLDE